MSKTALRTPRFEPSGYPYTFGLTSLGEALRDDGNTLVVGSSADWVRQPDGTAGDVERVWDETFKANLTPEEFEHYLKHKVTDSVPEIGLGRWNAYGGIRKDGSSDVRIATEFILLSDDSKGWDMVSQIQDTTGSSVWVLDERENQDDGPNHGRPEKQFELSWNVISMSAAEISEKIADLNTQTNELWEYVGVGVI